MSKKTTGSFYKSAITGRIVSEGYAKSRPKTTFKQTFTKPSTTKKK